MPFEEPGKLTTTCLKMNDEGITFYADNKPVMTMNSDAITMTTEIDASITLNELRKIYGLEPVEPIESVESPKRLKCEYCGTINNKNYGLCDYCGAPLSD